jgi:hypothetical protein
MSPQGTIDGPIDLPDMLGDVVIVIDREWRLAYLNRQALAVAGGVGTGLIGRNLWEAYPALLGTPVEAAYRRAMSERVGAGEKRR